MKNFVGDYEGCEEDVSSSKGIEFYGSIMFISFC